MTLKYAMADNNEDSLFYFCLMDNNFDMLAKCFYGFEAVLAKEIRDLGGQKVKEGVRSVNFVGDLGFLYKANLALRTALRILVPVHRFEVYSEDDLYKGLMKVDWQLYMDVEQSFAVVPP